MRLHRLEVEHFGPVVRARLELGPHLNVLDGPNDLGKSHLVQALRAVLLLPSTSTAAADWVPWGTDEKPRVKLDFETGPERFWRVEKTFSTDARGQAILRRSRDGEQWTTEAKSREVDGRLRQLLGWGIPEPGGSTRIRGLPESFLTQVVFPPQPTPGAIFAARLDDDHDETGRETLQRALETLAQDPLFQSVLEAAQEEVDRAFTATGRRSSARTSPFKVAAEHLKEAEAQARRFQDDLEKARTVETELQEAEAKRARAAEEHDDARRRAERLRTARAATEAVEKAEEEEKKARDLVRRARDLRTLQETRREEIRQAEEDLETLREVRRSAEDTRRKAETTLEQERSGEGRARERQRLDSRILELERTLHTAGTRFELAQRAAKAAEEIETKTKEQAELRARIPDARRDRNDGARELARLEARGAHAASWEARTTLRDLGKLAEEIAELDREIAGRKLPTPRDRLEELRRRHQELEVARAGVAVGLRVEVELETPREGRATVDGGQTETLGTEAHHAMEAERELDLEWDGVGRWRIRGGSPDARRGLEEAEERWRTEGEPVLAVAETPTLSLLSELVTRREEQTRTARATRLADRLRDLGEPEDGWAERLRSRCDELRARARERGVEDPDRPPEDRTSLRELRERFQADQKEQTERETTLERLTERESALTRELQDASAVVEEAERELEGPWEPALDEAERTQKAARSEKDKLEGERRELDGRGATAIEEAETRLRDARQAETTAVARLKAAEDAVTRKRTERDRASGALEELEAQEKAIDLDALARAVRTAREQVGPERVSAEALADAEEKLEAANTAREDRSRDVERLEGALQTVGGDVARENARRAEEALELARQQEREVEVDAEAWRLLAETLREAEQEESSHLGDALVEPVSRRFAELTGERYGAIGLDPDLGTTGLAAEGMLRKITELSQGLQEQLAALLRLTIAEQVGTFVVFDDHLVHTDADRLGWFRGVLREHAARAQILVVTKRAEDFLGESLEGAAEDCVRVDLRAAIERSGSGIQR